MTTDRIGSKNWLIYGANGYAAGLVIEEALRRGHRPILAGRNEASVSAAASSSGLSCRVFPLNDPAALRRGIEGVSLVAHLAGPYSATARPMLEACLEAKVDYIDITGEIEVFEDIFSLNERARDAGVTVVPGAGYDVVPTDCAASLLKDRLPDAVELELAFGGFGQKADGISHGTLKTMLETMGRGARVRRDGRLIAVPFHWRTPRVPFTQGTFRCVTMPWGDVSTAYRSTGIPSIAVYMAAPAGLTTFLRALRPLIANPVVNRALGRAADRWVRGPGADARNAASGGVWGRVRNAAGQTAELVMSTPEGYSLTATVLLAAVERVLSGAVQPGTWTPAQAFGKDFITLFDGVRVEIERRPGVTPADASLL